MKKAIRDEYAEKGVEAYYKANANVYENPHFPYIKALLWQNKHRINYERVLDFCAGGGEVTLIVSDENFLTEKTLEIKKKDLQHVGCDPFTYKLYEKNTGCPCLPFDFEDVIKGKLYKKLAGDSFTSVISSFGMHLCPEKQLFPLVYQLFALSENIVIITPHKRPQLEKLQGVQLLFEDFVLTEKGKKVFLKSYILRGG
jgi:hypothetical protein